MHLLSHRTYIHCTYFHISAIDIGGNSGTSKFDCFEYPLGDVLRTSWGCPKSTFQGRPLSVRLGRPLDVISGYSQDVRSGCPRDVRWGRPQDGQIGSLGDVLETFERDVLGTLKQKDVRTFLFDHKN